MRKTAIALLAVCAASTHTASGNEVGLYAGGYLGQSSKDAPRSFYEDFNDDIQAFVFFTPTQETTSFDDSDTAFGLVTGYRFTRYLAVEAGYVNFGKVSFKSRASGTYPLDTGTTDVTIESETTGFTFAVLGALPLSRDWELLARAGVLFADNKIRIEINSTGNQFIPPLGNSFSASDSESSTETFAALGISRRFLEIYSLRLEYQRAFDAGDEDAGGKGDLDVISLGVMVTF